MRNYIIMNRIFLIDLENVGATFLKGVETLSADDLVILFYSTDYGKLSSEVREKLETGKNAYRTVRTNIHTKNAMDFQICTYLGYLVAQYGAGMKYYFVTKDQGYDASIEFIRNNLTQNICIERIPYFEFLNEKQDFRKMIADTLPDYPRKIIAIVESGFKKCNTKTAFHNFLQKNMQDFKDVYQRIEPIYTEVVLGTPFTGKYNIGDEVTIRKDLVIGEVHGRVSVTKKMILFSGRKAKVVKCNTGSSMSYFLDIDNQEGTWKDTMFE